MAITLGNRIKVSTSTTGTGTITLGSAETGYQTFANGGISDGDEVRFVIEDGTAFEISKGTYTHSGTTLSRTLLESTTGALLNLSGDAKVFVTAAADDLILKDGGTFTGDVIFDGATAGYDIVFDRSDNALEFADNTKAKFGTGADLEIYHFGNSYINNAAGVSDLYIRNSCNDYDVKIQTDNGSGGIANYFVADGSTGAAELHWGDYSTNSGADGGVKLATNASGVTVSGTVTATSFSGDGSGLTGITSIPSGVIVMWSGSIANIPSGWYLCDGNNGTPNLTGKFVVHADADSGGTYAPNATGGANSVTLTVSQIPAHSHSDTYYGANYTGGYSYYPAWAGYGVGNTHVLSSDNTGGGGSHENRPPYYALAYIMKS